ncbi:DUF5133 domain-containing protein [Streptomyces olivochromogenes]|uniref:DUF5133 domain-containing protein n=1 Tax=Streptomyces olivochromogenes TaxID=1963 RepID=UPI00367AACB1
MWGRLDDAAYTLCVLMGQRNAADAVAQVESLLARASAEHGRRRGASAHRCPLTPDAVPRPTGSVLRHPGRARGYRLARQAVDLWWS